MVGSDGTIWVMWWAALLLGMIPAHQSIFENILSGWISVDHSVAKEGPISSSVITYEEEPR